MLAGKAGGLNVAKIGRTGSRRINVGMMERPGRPTIARKGSLGESPIARVRENRQTRGLGEYEGRSQAADFFRCDRAALHGASCFASRILPST